MKLFAFDLDKTTLDSKRKISISNERVLQGMVSKGIILIPATGRDLKGIPYEILNKGVRYVIVSNGAKVIDLLENKIIWQSCLSEKELLPLTQQLKNKRFIFSIHAKNNCYDSNFLQFFIRRILYKGTSILFTRFDEIMNLGNIDKIQLIFFSNKQLVKIYKLISRIESIHVVKSSKHSIEITNENATKGRALKHICDYLEIKSCEVTSIGDNDNDIEMLLFSGTSYAVRNSSEEVKKIADYIVSSNNENPLEDIILN